jgi:hypothetical protein
MQKLRFPTLLIIALVIVTALAAYHYQRRAIYGGADDLQEPMTVTSAPAVEAPAPLPARPGATSGTPTVATNSDARSALPKIKRNVLEYSASVPDGSEAPRTQSPVSAQDVAQMIQTDAGQEFAARDVRITPSGFSGRLNGGAVVEVGGDPDNSVAWKYNLVFGPDGVLAYSLKGHD